jgi:Regulator of ribonuclease activity B
MVKELARGWTPQRAEELRIRDKAERQTNGAEQPQRKVPENERMRHYFYFPEKSSAEKAAQRLRSQEYTAEVSEGADGTSWQVLVKHAPLFKTEDRDKLREKMEALASELNGEYDGWELAV